MINQQQADAIVGVLKSATPALTQENPVKVILRKKTESVQENGEAEKAKRQHRFSVVQVGKWTNCSSQTISRLCRIGKFKTERGKQFKWLILNSKSECQEIVKNSVTKSGWTRKGVKDSRVKNPQNSTNLLVEFMTWRGIPDDKRALLIQISEQPVENLKLILELIS